MQINLKPNWKLHHNWTVSLIVTLLILGVFFRFVNLDWKIYWYDETITSLRLAGYRQSEVVQQVFDGHEMSVEDLQKYQKITPEKSLFATIYSLASEAPQHPPLYFVMARFWVQWFGNSVAVTRSLSAFLSLLVFPCLYWLCLELFESSLVGWVAIALMAVSPFHVLYAQEAREYCLWTVTTLLSSAALLRAMRLNTKLSWGIYAATVALGLYSFTLSILVIIGHAVYVAATEKFRWSKKVIAYVVACLAGILIFAPWLLIIIILLPTTVIHSSSWTTIEMPLLSLVKQWFFHISRIFLDFNLDFNNQFICLVIPIFILEVYSIYFVCRRTTKQVWLFILTLIGVTALALILPDLLLGGRRSSITRYLMPSYLGIQLSVAYLLSTQIVSNSFSQRKIWQVVVAVLISGGVVSCAISSQAETWWNKYESYDNPQVAHIINQANRPLLLSASSANFTNVFSLSYLLDPKVRLRLVAEPNMPTISENFKDVFLYRSSNSLRDKLEKEYRIKSVRKHSGLWQLNK